jgi:hypothetical protein
MRVYVIKIDDHMGKLSHIDSVLSSRRAALKRCLEIVDGHEISVRDEGKHEGWIVYCKELDQDYTVSYKMFFINQIEEVNQ